MNSWSILVGEAMNPKAATYKFNTSNSLHHKMIHLDDFGLLGHSRLSPASRNSGSCVEESDIHKMTNRIASV